MLNFLINILFSLALIMVTWTTTAAAKQADEMAEFMLYSSSGISVEQDEITVINGMMTVDGRHIIRGGYAATMDGNMIVYGNRLIMCSNSVHPYTGVPMHKTVFIRNINLDRDKITEDDVNKGAHLLYDK